MSPYSQLQPLLAPQNDTVPSTGAAAKKKNKKKKSAAAKANAAQAASEPTSATPEDAPADDAPEPTASSDHESEAKEVTEPETQKAKEATDKSAIDNDKGEPVDNQKGDSTTKDGLDTPIDSGAPSSPTEATNVTEENAQDSPATNGHAIPLHVKDNSHTNNDTNGNSKADDSSEATDKLSETRNGDEPIAAPTSTKAAAANTTTATDTTTHTKTAMSQDDEALRAEVGRLRKQVEELKKAQEEHKEETDQLKTDLEESEAGREQAETQYQNLLGRVEKIKSTLGERLKRDKQELEEAKDRIEELEVQNETLREGGTAAEAAATAAEAQVARLQKELDDIENEHERENNAMRGRAQLSQQNWQREKADFERALQQLRKEVEEANSSMGEWEVIALEERSMRNTLTEKATDLEEQLAVMLEQNQRLNMERETNTNAIEGLQQALREIQETRKMELREMVSDSEAKLGAAEKRALAAEAQAADAVAKAEKLEKEVERTSPFEREVKEKNALIGKLRHEAIALNDHLTKALRYIKKNRPDDSVDKQVVTNLFLQFLALDRSDPKKFQVLQVIAGMLQWSDEQKEKAGLSRPGTSGSSLRMPSSPFARTPSTPALNTEFFADAAGAGGTRESLSELWANFLERSADESSLASDASKPSSRKGSNPAPPTVSPPPASGAPPLPEKP